MLVRIAFCWAMTLMLAVPALAQDDGVRRQVSDARILSVTATCFYGPHLDEVQAKRLCGYQSRGKLLDAAVAQIGASPTVRAGELTEKDKRAFVDSLLVVTMLNEEVRKVSQGLAVRLTLRGEENPGKLLDKLAAFKADPELRSGALAETAKHDRQAAEARMASIPFGGEREFAEPAGPDAMNVETAFATRRLVPGMSMASVKGLLGNPGIYRQAIIGADTYVCAGYGSLWVVFRDGVVSCVRTRLAYVKRYGTDCHCAGNYATILNAD